MSNDQLDNLFANQPIPEIPSGETPKRYYWEQPHLSGQFDLEAVQAQIREMTDEEVARAVLAIRLAPKGNSSGGSSKEKSPAQKAAEKTKRASQKELLAAMKDYLLKQAQGEAEEQMPLLMEDATEESDSPSISAEQLEEDE